MAYSALPAKVASDTLTLTNYNAIKGNFEAGVPDIFTAAGDIAYATAANAASALAIGTADGFLVAGASAPAWQIAPAARVANSADIDPATGSWVTLTFDTEDGTYDTFDTDAMHSVASNTGRLTCPTNGDGLYLIGGCVKLDASGAGTSDAGLRIYLNGSTAIHTEFNSYTKESSIEIAVCTLYKLSATDYVELQVYTESDFDVKQVSNSSPVFWAQWVRRQ